MLDMKEYFPNAVFLTFTYNTMFRLTQNRLKFTHALLFADRAILIFLAILVLSPIVALNRIHSLSTFTHTLSKHSTF